MEQVRWSLAVRLLHLGLVITVSLQLFVSLVMAAPDEEKASKIGRAAFEVHEAVGMTALAIVFAHWCWSLSSHTDGKLVNLFPWWGEARRRVFEEVRALFDGHLPQGGPHPGLPSLIHGLGLLAVTGMVLTGGVLFFLLPESGELSQTAELFAETHETIAGLVWVYWWGHGGLAVLHHYTGHDNLRAIFQMRRSATK